MTAPLQSPRCAKQVRARRRRPLVPAALLMTVSLFAALRAFAVNPDDAATRYRRIYVPAEHVEAWPIEGEKFLPIEQREFESLVAAANGATASDTARATIEEAQYWARLEGERLVECRGQWRIAVRSGAPAFLPLDDTSLVVQQAHWQSDPQRARIGAWGGNGGPAGTMGLEAARDGTLEFAWYAPVRMIHNGIEVAWRLPTARSARLILDLPSGTEPMVDGGVVLARQPIPDAHDGKGMGTEGGMVRWEVALNSSQATTLRLVVTASAAADSSVPLTLHEDMNYRITQRGLEIEATWHLDAAVHDRRELTVPLAKDLQFVSAATRDGELSWRIQKDDQSGAEMAIIELSESAKRAPMQITVRGWRPLVLEEEWILPSLRPDGIYWQSGNIDLTIGPHLELQSLRHDGCLQTGIDPGDGAGVEPEHARLAMFSPTAEINVLVARRRAEAAIRLGSSLALADPDINGQLVTEWTVSQGSLHTLSGELAPGWVVESVEAAPAEALGEWFIDERGSGRRIEIQLAAAARPGRRVTITISGRLQRRGIGEPMLADSMRIVDWAEGHVERHLLTFQTLEPYAIDVVGNLPVVEREVVSERDAALVNMPTGKETIFDLTRAGDQAGLALSLGHGQYEADIRLEAACLNQSLSQKHQLIIHPTTHGVDRLLVFATAPLGDDVRWTETSLNVLLQAERLPKRDPRRAGLREDGELWLVRLPGLTTRTVEIAATAQASWPDPKPVPLLAMPEALRQRGRVSVRADQATMPVLEPRGMQFVALPAVSDEIPNTESQPPLRAAYRYDPVSCLDDGQPPALIIGPSTRTDTRLLVARHVELESFFWANGRATHRASYELDNEGQTSFQPLLPPGAEIRAVFVDGRALEQPLGDRSGSGPSIPLPAGARSVQVSVHLETQQSPLAAGTLLEPPLVHKSIPILAGQWTIWLPAEFSTSDAGGQNEGVGLDWRQRLFGPLGRPARETPFHPLSSRDWARLLSPLGSLPTGTDSSPAGLSGWTAYRTSFIAEEPAAVSVAHPPAITSWAIALFMLCIVAGRWLRRQGVWFVMLLAGAAALALVLPAEFAPVATGAFLGLSISLFAVWPRMESAAAGPPRSWSRISTVTVPTVLIWLAAVAYAMAEPPRQTETAPANGIERVLIPVNADGRPSGQKYFVREQFVRELMQPGVESSDASRRWILRDALYEGKLREQVDAEGIAAAEWSLAFQIEVLTRDTTIELPLVREEAAWQDTAMLDGVPVPIDWREGGHRCAIEISEPGQYALRVFCVPRTAEEKRREAVKLTVPPLAGARLELEYPPSLGGLTVSGAVAAVTPTAASAWTGLTDRSGAIGVRWQPAAWAADAASSQQVTGMRWLRVDADAVVLETKYIIEGSARRSEALTVAFDRRWELLDHGSSPNETELAEEPDGQRSVRVALSQPTVERQEVKLRWRLRRAAPFGRLRLPPVELLSMPVTHRWLAISAAPEVECEILDGSASAGSVNEFQAMWGEADDAPQTVLGNLQASIPWSVAVRPRQHEPLIEEALHIAADRSQLHVAYQADVAPGTTNEFQYQLVVPPDLSIDEIVLASAGRRVPVRWSRVGATRVNVFFSERLAADYRVMLRGSVPLESGAERPLPRVTAAARQASNEDVQIYRDERVLVEMTGLSDADRLSEGLRRLPPTAWTARPVGVFRLDGSAFRTARLAISPNDVQVEGASLVALTQESDAWTAAYSARLTVTKGQLDTLRLHAPAAWAGPFSIDCDVLASMELEASEDRDPVLLVHFAESIPAGGMVQLTIRGPLTKPLQQSASVPAIRLQPQARGKHYVVVPSNLDRQPIAWSEAGVRPAEPQAEFRSTLGIPLEGRWFEVVDSPFHVAIQPPAAPKPSANVGLADTTVWTGGGNADLVETRLVVAAPELADCILDLPAAQELLSVRLNGQPAITQPVETRRWRVALGPQPLPQILDIVSVARTDGDRTRRLRRPLLLANGKRIPVEVSLWSIGHSQPGAEVRVAGAAVVDEADQAALRLHRLTSIAESATPSAVDAPPPDGDRWYRLWADRLASLRDEALDKTAGPPDFRAPSQVSPAAMDQVAEASERLDRWIEPSSGLFLETAPDEQAAAAPLGSAGQLDDSLIREWLYCVADGDAESVRIDLGPSVVVPTRARVAGLLAIGCAAAAGLWLNRRPAAADVLYRWPHAIAFLGGIAFWAWLWPSWLGIVIAAFSLWLPWRFGWPGRSLPMERSTVVRLPRSEVIAP